MLCTCSVSSAMLLLILSIVVVITANPTTYSKNDPRAGNQEGIELLILHTNDMHARFEQTSQLSGTCSDSEAANNRCYGGFARVATAIRNARNKSTPVLFLNAGDTYQGTVWFTVHKWKIVAKFLSILEPDAISLGNHEFDDGVAGLVPFLNNVTSEYPVLAANLNFTNEPELAATNVTKSTIVNVNGTQIGIIGYLTPETKQLATTGNVIFEDEVLAITEEAKRLKSNGVNILIALGHSGFTMDKKIAAEVEDIDLVIGGHTNTFLFNGTQPDSEIPAGLYPTAVTQSNGKIVYVVQAYAYTKYLGNLSVTFDSNGELTHIQGNPILLDSSVEQAKDVLDELENWRDGIANLTNTIVGSTRVLLNGGEICRRVECNMGNLITDALIDYNSRQYDDTHGWTDSAIAAINGGSIRTSVTTSNDHQITMADVLAVLPFGNSALSVNMTGEDILSMLETGVYHLTEDENQDYRGGFLQFSGMQVTYDLSQESNSKVISVQVRCANCTVPVFSDLDKTKTYNVIVSDYMYSGGDNFTMLSDLKYRTLDESLADIVVEYLNRRSPVYPAVEWRINFSKTARNSAYYVTDSIFVMILSLLMRVLT